MIIKTAWRNFVRNKWPSIVSVLISAALTAFILAFCSSIEMNKLERENAYDTIEVNAYIAGASATREPSISEDVFQALMNSGFIDSYTASMKCSVNGQDTLKGVDSVDIDVSLKEYAAAQSIEWLEGYSESVFTSDEMVCVVPGWLSLQNGEIYTAVLSNGKGTHEMTVVGIYGSGLSASSASGSIIYCPLATLKGIYEECGSTYHYNGLQMRLCNTRNLDKFKADMLALGLDRGGAKLVINDTLLNDVTSKLTQQINLLNALLPVLFALIIVIGFGASFILLRRRKREAAVMRSVGATRGNVLGILMAECAMQAVIGCVLGIVGVLAASFMPNATLSVNPLAPFIPLCYLIGGALAAGRMAKVNVLKLMTAKE